MKKNIVIFYPDPLPPGRLYVDNLPPTSALCAVRLLERSKYNIQIISRCLNGKGYLEEILDACNEAILFGVSSFVGYQINHGLFVAKKVKEKFKDLPVVWGGWFPSSAPILTLSNRLIDIVAVGQGEKTLLELVEALEDKKPFSEVPGIYYKKNGSILKNNPRPLTDINDLPMIPYELLGRKNIIYNRDGLRTTDYMTSYGCPHRCAFCCEPAVNKGKWTGLTPEKIISGLKYLKEAYNIQAVTLLDTNFFVDTERIRKFARLYAEENLNIKFIWTSGKISHLMKFDDELWNLVKGIGIDCIQIGVESCRQEYLDILQKDNKNFDTLNIIKKADKFNIKLSISTMIGIPGADIKLELSGILDMISNSLDINQNNKFVIFFYTPLPATKLLPKAEELGFRKPESLEDWAKFEENKISVPWVNKSYGKILERINFYGKYILTKDLVNSTPSRFLRFIYSIIRGVMFPLVRFRFKKKYFCIPIDYYMLKFILLTGVRLQKLIDMIIRKR